MPKVPSTTDNVEPRHDRLTEMALAYVAAVRGKWFEIPREDRLEAERVLVEMVTSLHTLGVRP